ncbi:MAG: NACHT domain-containing protein [Candidatus Pacebacteria bacterium]|nr:NACHT domain-containing protein [Candidatus Paceibacterota bacterium]
MEMFADWFVSKALSPVAIKLATKFLSLVKEPVARKLDEIKVSLQFGFDAYVKNEIERYSKIKTILGVNVHLDIAGIYVNLYLNLAHAKFSNPKEGARAPVIRDDEMLTVIDRNRRIVVTGTAGCGKSMLMRYLFLQTLSQRDHLLPVFVELRDLNDKIDTSIVDYVNEKIRGTIESFTIEQTKFALKEGTIVLFLDGFDEIDYDRQAKRAKEITQLGNAYSQAQIYVSGRPDDIFQGWDRFYVYKVVRLTRGQVEALVDKIPYDEDLKSQFLRKLDAGLYESHKEFLVNPLLTIMMLITLEQFSEIPAKIHLFYEYAFEALFARHDSTKSGGFQRKRHVTLPLDDYRRLLSYFCTISYLREIFRFNHATILDIIERSVSASQIEVQKQDMLDDLVSCTCMIARDGLDFVFSHRSFQEYFTAYFVANVKTQEMAQVVPKLAMRGRNDNVILMLSEMNRETFERAWVLPQLRLLWERVMKILPERQLIQYLYAIQGVSDVNLFVDHNISRSARHTRIMWGTISDRRRGGREREKESLLPSLIVLHKVYDLFHQVHKKVRGAEDPLVVEEIVDGKLLSGDRRFD